MRLGTLYHRQTTHYKPIPCQHNVLACLPFIVVYYSFLPNITVNLPFRAMCWIYRHAAEKRIPAFKEDGAWCFSHSEIEQWI